MFIPHLLDLLINRDQNRTNCGLIHKNEVVQLHALFSLAGDFSCTFEVPSAIPVLKDAYGGSLKNVLHVGPESCSVVSKLLSEGETEAWGLEPYEIGDVDRHCKALVHKGIVRVADIKFPLPYRPNSFSHVLVSDAFDYLSPKYMNKTLPELARVSAHGIIIFTGTSFWNKCNHSNNGCSSFPISNFGTLLSFQVPQVSGELK